MTAHTKAAAIIAAAIGIGAIAIIAILAMPYIADAITEDNSAFGEFPQNLGYLRATERDFGRLTIFDADTFEVYRTIDLPQAFEGSSHRLERDDKGRIWIGYSQEYTDVFPWNIKEEVRVFSARGDLEHVLDTQCGPPEGGIAFANGYAFIGCIWSGFSAKIVVVDVESMNIVKTLEVWRPHPDPEITDPEIGDFFLDAVEEVDGSILAIGRGHSPADYVGVTPRTNGITIVARIDPETLTVDEYKAELPPGTFAMDAVEVDGAAWLLNSESNIVERPPRVDVYAINPHTLEVLDSFNLDKPYPTWGERGADGYVHIYHMNAIPSDFGVGHLGGVTRINPDTRETEYFQVNNSTGRNAPGFIAGDFATRDDGTPFVVMSDGLWRVGPDGKELVVEQEFSIGVLFAPTGADASQARRDERTRAK